MGRNSSSIVIRLPQASRLAHGSGHRGRPRYARRRIGISAMSLFMDIGQGAGLSGASGVRPFLPALLAGALAREDSGLDFSGTSFSFLESPAFLLAVLLLAVGSYGLQRRRETVAQTTPAGRPGDPRARVGGGSRLPEPFEGALLLL